MNDVFLPSSMEHAAKVAAILGALMDPKHSDKYLPSWSWESRGSMVVCHRGELWDKRPSTSDPEMRFLLANGMVDLYSSPFIEAYCIRLLPKHMPKAEVFMKLYTERLQTLDPVPPPAASQASAAQPG